MNPGKQRKHNRRHLPRAARLATLIAAMTLACGVMAQSAAVDVNISAQPLDQALRTLSRQSGAQIVFATDQLARRAAPSVSGKLTIAQALEQLLAGSGLRAKSTGPQAFVITASPEDAPPVPEVKLAPTEVTGSRPSLFASAGASLGALGEKPLEQVPFSVQAYNSELMNTQDARTLMDVVKNDPSIQDATQAGAYETVRIRGFFVDWTNTIRRDGMSVAPYYEIPLENIEQIDVLKGPSGFLYGINSPGGTINYVIKRPTRDAFASVKTAVRDHSGYYASADLGGPLADGRFGYRLNVAGEKLGDFTHNGDLSRKFIAGAFDWAITPAALLRLNFDYQERKIAAQPAIGPYPDGTLPPPVDPRVLLGQPWLQYETKTYNVGADFSYRFNDAWKLTSRVAQSYNARVAAFPDIYNISTNGNILSGDIYLNPDQNFRVLSTDTYVSGNFATGPIKHQLVTGVSTRNFSAVESGFTVLGTTVGNIYQPVYSPAPGGLTFPAKNASKNYQPSVFVSDVMSFGPKWDLLLGLRHISYRNDSMPASGKNTEQRASVNAPSFALTFKPLPGLSTYVSYAEGYEQPGPAGYDTNNAGENLPPLKTRQYEFGVKSRVTDGLLLTGAVFRLEKTLQYVNAAHFTVQGGMQRHTGLELTANGRITGALSMVSGIGLLRTEADNPADPTVAGKRIADVPNLQASTFLDYRIAAVPGLSINGGVYYVGRRALDAQNTRWMAGYTRFDAGARYTTRVAGYRTTFGLTVQNLTDKRYWAAGDPSINGAWAGKPRTVWLSAQFDL
ncbi:TonB-dependent siderophore receptor [Ralstonia solanacearum]|uniref:TonB-dependent siderophore receptor n=1 Tax=Ralstonia solanacearum TaxID=305 RepID=UPI0006DCDF9C|nr:TonB-dependent receptor [Ralstonia solanacearum]QHB53784.1 TonB-dependent siderophore receptor [Ralstonia solanacearum]